MVCDHIHQMFHTAGAPVWLTALGRPVFPLFLFLAADSLFYTRNRRRYLLRLGVAGLLTASGSLLLTLLLPNDNIVLMNNAFYAFLMVGLYCVLWDTLVAAWRQRRVGQMVLCLAAVLLPLLLVIPMLLLGALVGRVPPEQPLPEYLSALSALVLLIPNPVAIEGGFAMVVLGVLFYIFRQHRYAQYAVLLLLSVLVWARGNALQSLMVLALLPMMLYNGKSGRRADSAPSFGDKWFFYIFYPVHLYALYIIASVWFQTT